MGAAEIFGSGLCAAPVPQHSGASTFTTGYLYSRRSRQDPLDGETHLGVPPVLVIVIGSP